MKKIIVTLMMILLAQSSYADQWRRLHGIQKGNCEGGILGDREMERQWQNGHCFALFAETRDEYDRYRSRPARRDRQIEANRRCVEKFGGYTYYDRQTRKCISRQGALYDADRRRQNEEEAKRKCRGEYISSADGYECIAPSTPSRSRNDGCPPGQTRFLGLCR